MPNKVIICGSTNDKTRVLAEFLGREIETPVDTPIVHHYQAEDLVGNTRDLELWDLPAGSHPQEQDWHADAGVFLIYIDHVPIEERGPNYRSHHEWASVSSQLNRLMVSHFFEEVNRLKRGIDIYAKYGAK